MHYTGMAAMIMPADMSYDTTIVGISVAIAIVAAIVALWLAFNLRGNLQRFGSALVMGVAVCGMHYTGMSALTLTANNGEMVRSTGISPEIMALSIFIVSSTLLITLLVIAFFNNSKLSQDNIVFE